jgi:hypothetical protein
VHVQCPGKAIWGGLEEGSRRNGPSTEERVAAFFSDSFATHFFITWCVFSPTLCYPLEHATNTHFQQGAPDFCPSISTNTHQQPTHTTIPSMSSLTSSASPAFASRTVPGASTCVHASNNKHFKCPPRMADGRHFTDYRPNCYTNNLVQESNELQNSNDMRSFLTHNATGLMQLNRKQACERNCCGPCQKPYQSGTMMPEATGDVLGTPVGCSTKTSQPSVVPTHSSAPLSCSAWDSGNVHAPEYNCCSPVKDLSNMYPTPSNNVVVSRRSQPFGGQIPTQSV